MLSKMKLLQMYPKAVSRSCLRQKIGPCALTSVRYKIGVTSSNNETSPAIVTHNSSDKKSVRVR